ncbi:MAG: CDGSH iron-sulfur domain-containing protein [Rhodobacteraceae bacterium]|jgi:CDGSH-type Zn-finger protein|nr:CDGSH iron-sulfur domain-containing protein [Paracoccaceae bacterium]
MSASTPPDAARIARAAPFPAEVEAGRTYAWCACGRSGRQPFCDGSHKGTAFTPLRWTADTDGRRFFCGCKATATPPFCDGSHRRL